jgi:hypothetical protein
MLPDHDGCFIGIWMPPQAQDVLAEVQHSFGLPDLVAWESSRNNWVTRQRNGNKIRKRLTTHAKRMQSGQTAQAARPRPRLRKPNTI